MELQAGEKSWIVRSAAEAQPRSSPHIFSAKLPLAQAIFGPPAEYSHQRSASRRPATGADRTFFGPLAANASPNSTIAHEPASGSLRARLRGRRWRSNPAGKNDQSKSSFRRQYLPWVSHDPRLFRHIKSNKRQWPDFCG